MCKAESNMYVTCFLHMNVEPHGVEGGELVVSEKRSARCKAITSTGVIWLFISGTYQSWKTSKIFLANWSQFSREWTHRLQVTRGL